MRFVSLLFLVVASALGCAHPSLSAEELLPCGLPAGQVTPLNLCGKGPQAQAGGSMGIHYGRQPLLAEVTRAGLPSGAADLDAPGLLELLASGAEKMASSGVDEKGLLSIASVWGGLMAEYSYKPFLQALFDPMWNSRLDTIGWELDSLLSDLRGNADGAPSNGAAGEKGTDLAERMTYVAELARSLANGVSAAAVEKKLREVLDFDSFRVFRGAKVDFFIGLGPDGNPTGVATCFGEKGSGGPLRLVVGIDPSGKVTGVSLVEHAETWQDFDVASYLGTFKGLNSASAGANEPEGERRPMILAGASAIRFGVQRSLFVFSRFSGVLDDIRAQSARKAQPVREGEK